MSLTTAPVPTKENKQPGLLRRALEYIHPTPIPIRPMPAIVQTEEYWQSLQLKAQGYRGSPEANNVHWMKRRETERMAREVSDQEKWGKRRAEEENRKRFERDTHPFGKPPTGSVGGGRRRRTSENSVR
ncbi:MAG: hypothetical protein ACHQX1_00700 [Candidatus Micrarchaeales archaeon]